MTDPAAGGEGVRGIGARLRGAREARGLTVLQAAEKLHVDPRVLDALESEDFPSLGADVFVRGHLRRYAELVGESPAELQELYVAAGTAVPPDLTRIPHAGVPAQHPPFALPALMMVVGLAIAGVVWWAMKLPQQKPQPLTPVSAVPAPPVQTPPAERSVPRPVSSSGARPAASGAAAASPAVAQLALHVAEDSWIEVTDADGKHLLHGLLGAGSARELSGTPPLRVVLGKVPAVALALNGQRLDIQKLAHRDGSARLIIDAAGEVSAAPARLAHGD